MRLQLSSIVRCRDMSYEVEVTVRVDPDQLTALGDAGTALSSSSQQILRELRDLTTMRVNRRVP